MAGLANEELFFCDFGVNLWIEGREDRKAEEYSVKHRRKNEVDN